MNITNPLDEQDQKAAGTAEDGAGEQEAHSKLPKAAKCLQGCYVDFLGEGKDGQKLLANSASYIGVELAVAPIDGAGDDELWVSTTTGIPIGRVPWADSPHLASLISNGWSVKSVLSLVTYSSSEGGFFGEAAIMCIAPDCADDIRAALEQYEAKQVQRIKGGDHPRLDLNQEQFAKVVESGGEWHMTKLAKLTKEQHGRMSYKRNQSVTGKMMDMSMTHRMGCSIASTIFLLALLGFAIWAIARLFL